MNLCFRGSGDLVHRNGCSGRRCCGTAAGSLGQADRNGAGQGEDGGAILGAYAHVGPATARAARGYVAINQSRSGGAGLLIQGDTSSDPDGVRAVGAWGGAAACTAPCQANCHAPDIGAVVGGDR